MFEGNDISVLRTYGYRSWNISSKQRSIEVFHESTWGIGLEMEGSYYQKAIQSASKIRKVFPMMLK
jgi:hypothetical protein